MMVSLLDRSRRSDVTFHSDGRIDISAGVSKSLGLVAGDVVDVLTDGRDYFLCVRHRACDVVGRHEARVWAVNRSCRRHNHYRCWSRRLCRAVLDVCGGDVARVIACDAEETDGKTVVPLIIRRGG